MTLPFSVAWRLSVEDFGDPAEHIIRVDERPMSWKDELALLRAYAVEHPKVLSDSPFVVITWGATGITPGCWFQYGRDTKRWGGRSWEEAQPLREAAKQAAIRESRP